MAVQTQSDDRSTRVTRSVGTITGWLGSFPAILLSVLVVSVWFGGAFIIKNGFTNTNYQLIINTGTTIVTFWMVFIIQNTQNRDGRAMQAKLDAQSQVIRAVSHVLGVNDLEDHLAELVGLEDAPESVIKGHQDAVRQATLDSP